MEILFHSHANKTYFHKKGCVPSFILNVRVFGTRKWPIHLRSRPGGGGGGVLPYMGYIGMCRCEGYGFQAVYSRIGYINQSVWV